MGFDETFQYVTKKSEEQFSSDEEADCGGGGASAGGSALPSAPGGVAVGGADKGKGKGYQTRDHHKKQWGPKEIAKENPNAETKSSLQKGSTVQ